MSRVIWMLVFLLSPVAAFATSPCVPLTPEQFEAVKDESDLIIHAKVIDYHAAQGNPHAPQSWTDLEVLKVYKGEAAQKNLRLGGWSSYFMPLYPHDKGVELVLLLKRTEAGYQLTDASWKKCVPAVIGLPEAFPLQWKGRSYTREEFIDARLNPVPPAAE
jgi:hypothetical protein